MPKFIIFVPEESNTCYSLELNESLADYFNSEISNKLNLLSPEQYSEILLGTLLIVHHLKMLLMVTSILPKGFTKDW